MSVLTSLLVRDRVVPVSKIEEALQHQVLVGGDIETILLEMNLVPEDVLAAYRAALFGLLPATREEVMRATREAVRRVPRELARGAGFVPLLMEGRTLVVAAAEPPSDEISKQIRGQLGCDLAVRVVTQVRLAAALAHHYGFELDARTRKLTENLRKREPGVIPYVRPATPSGAPAASLRPPPVEPVRAEAFGDPDTLARPIPPVEPLGERDPAGFTLSEPAPEARGEPAPAFEVLPPPGEEPTEVPPVPRFGRAKASTIPPSTVSPHISRGVRGPIDRERALGLLADATQRDDVLFVLLRYAQQFFDFVAVFSLGKEGARGRMAHGGGLAAELMEQVVIPLGGSGVAALAARDRRPIVGDLSASDEERAAAALLGRPPGRPGLAVPITLRSRAVLLVYGDRNAEGVSIEDAEPLLAVAPAVAEALRRLIVENKTLRRPSERPGPTPSRPAPGALHSPALSRPVPAAESSEGRPPESLASLAHAVVRSVAPEAPGHDARLTAVDLETVARAPVRDRRQTVPLHSAVLEAEGDGRDGARAKVFGVPRAAPLPPARESLHPIAGAGAYSYVASAGVIEETVRPSRAHSLAPAAQAGVARPIVEPAPAPPVQVDADEPPVRPTRPSLQRIEVDGPSMIVDMGDQVAQLVESLLGARANQEPEEIGELLKLGEVALPVLMQHFPGPLWFDRKQPHKRRPRGRDVSPIARAIVAFGDGAAPYLASALGSNDEDVRFYALMVAGEVVHPDLLDAVAKHVLEPDDELRAVSLEVLRSYAGLPQFGAVLRAIGELSARAGKDARRQRLAVEALGELRDPRSLRALLPRLSDVSESVVQASHRALVTLTGQDFGLAARKWENWAEQWGRAHRVEWLIESLLHGDESVRALAGEELKQLTQQYFGYHPALPRRDRELAQRKYREWWETEGRAVFGYFN